MSSAASQALSWCSLSSSGAFQNAMMASPIYLSIVPLRARIALVRGVRNRFISFVNPCGSCLKDSEMVVKPLTSENMMVITEEHTSELQSHLNLVCRLLLEKKKPYPSHTTNQPRHYLPCCP